jgi:two-component system cell cycle sensor histidine kinase/response regulator CckA
VAIGSEHRPKAEGSFPESEDRFRTLLETMGERTAELARSDERFRLALRIASIQLGDFDRDLRYRWVYDPGSGFDQARVAGRRFDELNPGPDAGRFVAFQKSVLETGSGARAEMAFGAGDARRVYDVIAEPLRDHAGGVTGLLTAAMDITQQRRLEAQFLQARKMEAIGRLAGGIAHDFNNMMQVVAGFAARMLRNLAAGDPLRPDVEGIRRTAERAADLTRKLLALGRRQVLQSVVLDLNQLVSEAVPMLRRTLGDDIEILMLLQPGLGRVKADPGSLEQILVNLAANARDAMPRGGTLTLETSDVEIGESPSFGEPVVAPGPYVRLSVTDTGCGMDKETLANLFEPFFTTKPRGKGTGLGLATSYGTVRQSGGILRVCSEPGQGTTFEISLPRVEDALHPRETGKAPAPAPGGSETILLVEDDEDVRRLMALELEDLGYQVIQARDRGEALQRSRERRGPIHLLLTDVILAGPSGRAVAESLGEERPGIRTLYISGHTEAHIVRRGILIPGTHFLQKPFSTEQLATKIREALAGAPRPPDAAETDAPGCKPGAP